MDFLDFQSAFLEHILLSKPLGKELALEHVHRLDAYKDGYPARIYEALTETYPALEKLLESDFINLALAYAEQTLSSSYDLSQTAKDFPLFLQTYERTADYPILSDLAAFEWEHQICFHSKKKTASFFK